MKMMYIGVLITVVVIVVSYFKLYRLTNVTVAYQDSTGQVRGYAFDYAGHWNEDWLDISSWERYVAEKKNMPMVKIVKIKVNTKWKLRRA